MARRMGDYVPVVDANRYLRPRGSVVTVKIHKYLSSIESMGSVRYFTLFY